ncbi:hypothetical protein [Arthrobacter bambusae]|nr:hypothetical protein [Arthrobacter bambusae]MDQ0029922.1 hypothetical protein [Arthrobacter bambusae]MDQ0097560.1 hypothetical protein [Arthrobacter bambusae]
MSPSLGSRTAVDDADLNAVVDGGATAITGGSPAAGGARTSHPRPAI